MAEVSIVYCKPCGYADRAAKAAAAIQKRLKLAATLIPGKGGIFEVRVNDKPVVKRAKGYFPDAADIVAAVSAALTAER
jgi:selenoprotein W-related protein